MTAYTSRAMSLPSGAGYANGDTLTLADGSTWRFTPAGWVGALSASGLSTFSKRNTVPYASDGACLQDGAISGGTWCQSFTVPFPFDSVRVGLVSTDTTHSASGLKVIVAASETAAGNGSQWPVVGGSRDDTKWSAATFGGAAAGTPQVAASAANPSVTWTDWTPVKSLPRTDGYGNYIFLARAYLPNAWAVQPGYSAVWSTKTAAIAAMAGEMYEARYSSSDCVATPGGWNASNTVSACPGLVFQFRSSQPVNCVAGYGDSTFQGFAGTATYSWLEMAVRALAAAGARVVHRNGGWSGQTTAQVLTRMKADISRGERPTCIVFEGASPNDISQTYTTATLNTNRGYVLDAIDQAQSLGVPIIVTTPMPYMGSVPDAANKAAYQEYYTWVKALASQAPRVGVLDFSPLHDPAQPGKWAAGMSDDGLHPNDATKLLMCAMAKKAIEDNLVL